jgi:tetratricopeptide (TPR) repeat protein
MRIPASRLYPVHMLAVFLLVISVRAQQSRPGNANDAPGWPITNPQRGTGRVVPDATLGVQSPATDRAADSCSMWSVSGARQTTANAATLKIPAKAEREYGKACHDLKARKLPSAETHLRKAIQQSPQYAAAWVLMGQVLGASNRFDEARAACAKATVADAGDTSAYLCLADVAAGQQQWNQALAMADRALALSPTQDPYAYFYSAISEFHLGRLDEAQRNAKQAIEADPFQRIPQAHLLLAQIYAAKDDVQDAVIQLGAYLKVAPNSPDAAAAREKIAQLQRQGSK